MRVTLWRGSSFIRDPDIPDRPRNHGVLVRARFDCMSTDRNTAIVGGEIYDSNVRSAIGLRVLLVVEDNGTEGERDRLAWGIYQNPPTGWTPKDAEREDDEGARLRWWATDFERPDDVGVPSDLSKVVRCKTFPAGSYEFPEFRYGGGDLQVRTR